MNCPARTALTLCVALWLVPTAIADDVIYLDQGWTKAR